jgi:hypothetical protein
MTSDTLQFGGGVGGGKTRKQIVQLERDLASARAERDMEWTLAIAFALGTNSGYRVPIVPAQEQLRKLFDAVREAELDHLAASNERLQECINDLNLNRDRLTDENAALKRDAAVGAAIQRAAKELPYGWEVEICIEQGAGTVVLRDPDGNLTAMDVDSDNRLAAEIDAAADAAQVKP